MGTSSLATLLWRERQLLELLVLKLEEEQLMLTEGRLRWLRHVVREVEAVLVRLRVAGNERAAAASAVAVEWGLGEDATLGQLVDHARSDACRNVLQAHLCAVTSLTAQIAGLQDRNLTSLGVSTRSTLERLATAGAVDPAGRCPGRGVPATVGANGSTDRFDRQG